MELGADSNLFDLFLERCNATPHAPAYRQFVQETATAPALMAGRASEASRDTASARDPADVQDAQMPRRPGTAVSGLNPVGDAWVDVTWAEVAREVARFQAALAREGLKPGERVALCLRNRVEWVCFDQAAASLGLVTVPLYFDDRPDNMAYLPERRRLQAAVAGKRRALAGAPGADQEISRASSVLIGLPPPIPGSPA